MNTKRILHTLFKGLLAILVLAGCMDDDLVKNNSDVVEGVPITVSLKLSGSNTSNIVVDTKASGSDYSYLNDLVIFIFDGIDGQFEDVVTNYHDINTLTVKSNTIDNDTKNRLYNVEFKTTSGRKKLLAVANVAEGGYWGKVIDQLTVAYQKQYSFNQVKSLIVSLREDLIDGVQPFHITASSQMFISGWNENVVFGPDNKVTYGDYGDQTNQVVVKMNRAMANITFNIAANPDPDKAQGTFTPTSYRVYNIPTKSYLINDLQGKTDYSLTKKVEGVTYINTASENIGTAQEGKYTFDFYMPENIQEKGKNIYEYADRDKWEVEESGTSVSGALPEDKKWANAPQNSTFVVISGIYEGKATVDKQQDQDVTANVEYTIHLGDFGKSTDQRRDFTDFSVMRNYSYTYNVQVLGVNNIIVEAISDNGEEKQSGAEGSVYDRTNTEYSYNLDAHYEQVYLEYNLSDIANSLREGLVGQELDDAIANQLNLTIQSEMMNYTHAYLDNEPYAVRNKRGTLSPYKIYADAVRDKSGQDADDAAATAKSNVLAGAGTDATPEKGFDYKWIEFLPQTDENMISAYPGISSWAKEDLTGGKTDGNEMNNKEYYAGADGETNQGNGDPTKLIDVYDMIVEMGKAIKEIYTSEHNTPSTTPEFTNFKIKVIQNSNDYVARFTAFVNEYYYLRHPLTGAKATSWSRMTNKMPREMIIAMSTETSDDGNSSYSKIHSYITQLAMQTFYNDELSSINAFGMETYNETPLSIAFGTPISTTGLTDNDGRKNQKILIGASSSPNWWSDYISLSYNGWTASVGTNRTEHKLRNAYKNAYSACMSRNRDLNGNGLIDENEIRWFLPSLNEYIRMGIGNNGISSAAQLYMGDKTTMDKSLYPTDYVNDGALYYTSSEDAKRVYWAIEMGSYGPVNKWSGSGPFPIRCIRNLPATDISRINDVVSDATYKYYENTSPNVIVFKDRLVSSLYRQRASGSLEIHNEDGDANSFYYGIFVADNFLRTENPGQGYTYTYTLGDIIGYDGTVIWNGDRYSNNGTMTNPCAGYDQDGYTDWRVPNLVELSAMNAAGLLSPKPDGYGGNDVACCTQFTKQSVRYGFAFSSLIYCPGAETQQINNQVLIRCVRDVPANFTFPTN